MSLFGANSAQPVQGVNATPQTTRSNPDRQRREKREKKKEDGHPHRDEDRAEITSHQDDAAEAPAPAPPPIPPASDERPHIDIQG